MCLGVLSSVLWYRLLCAVRLYPQLLVKCIIYEPSIYRTQGKHTNNYTADVVCFENCDKIWYENRKNINIIRDENKEVVDKIISKYPTIMSISIIC